MRLNMTARQQRQALSIVAMSVRLALAPADGLNPVQHEAMDDASTPPPGLYYLGYFLNYRSNNLRTPVSNERVPGDVRVENTSFVNRLMWMTDSKLLGADYGMEVIVPMVHSSMHSSTYGLDRHESGGSDIYLSPLILGWHMPRWDVSAGAGVWLDSGRAGALGPGLGYQRYVLSGGATYYLDEAKVWSTSALLHYQRNGKADHGWRFGDQASVEWGVGRRWGLLQTGVVGYSRWQVSRDQGLGTLDGYAQNHAVGLQASYIFLPAKMMLRAAYYKEFGAKAATLPVPQGDLLRLTLIKAF